MKPDIVQVMPYPPQIQAILDEHFTCHRLYEAKDRTASDKVTAA